MTTCNQKLLEMGSIRFKPLTYIASIPIMVELSQKNYMINCIKAFYKFRKSSFKFSGANAPIKLNPVGEESGQRVGI